MSSRIKVYGETADLSFQRARREDGEYRYIIFVRSFKAKQKIESIYPGMFARNGYSIVYKRYARAEKKFQWLLLML